MLVEFCLNLKAKIEMISIVIGAELGGAADARAPPFLHPPFTFSDTVC